MVSRVKALSIALLTLTALAPGNVFARQIEFSKEIPADQINTLKADLQKDITFISDAASLRVFGLSDFNSDTLKKWLTDRVGFVISEKEDINKRLYVLQKPYFYVNPTTFPTLEKARPKATPTPAPTPTAAPTPVPAPPVPSATPRPGPIPDPSLPAPPKPSATPKPEVVTVMSNLGAPLYLEGKAQGLLIGYDFESPTDKSIIALRSPRVGLIQIGRGLFLIYLDRKNKPSIVNSYYRLATLFHEAHHSDGNGASLGFTHAVCPDGHDYENEYACDRNANGPYAVGAEFMKQARATCMANNTCTAREAELLAFASIDSFNRIIDTKLLDENPE